MDGRWLWTTQGKACGTTGRATQDAHQGRSLAQINSRLFELTGTAYLAKVLHLQVSHLSLQRLMEHKILSGGDNTLAFFCHESNIQVKSIRVM
jgi:hypothetical protein